MLHSRFALGVLAVLSLSFSYCGGGGSPSAPSPTPTPAPVASIRIDSITGSGAFVYDPSKSAYANGPAVVWHVTVTPGFGTYVRMTAFNSKGAPCMLDGVDLGATAAGNGKTTFGDPESADEWNKCAPKVNRVVAELMAQRTSASGIVMTETPVDWTMLEAKPPSTAGGGGTGGGGGTKTCCKVCTTGTACGDTCIAAGKQCHTAPGCACNG